MRRHECVTDALYYQNTHTHPRDIQSLRYLYPLRESRKRGISGGSAQYILRKSRRKLVGDELIIPRISEVVGQLSMDVRLGSSHTHTGVL